MYGCGMDTTTLSFPSTAVAMREAMAQRQPQSTNNVRAAQAQSRDLELLWAENKCYSIEQLL